MVRTFAPEPGTKFDMVQQVRIDYNRVVAVGPTKQTILDSQPRSITLTNANAEVFVAQFQVPVGQLAQLRFSPTRVTMLIAGGEEVELDPESSDLPSWLNTGWKVVPADGAPFDVVKDSFTGVRGLFRFDDRLVGPASGGQSGGNTKWKAKPTLPAELFDPNPGSTGPGPLIDHVTLVVRPGITPAAVQALAADAGTTVVRTPHGSRWYRIKLPLTLDMAAALAHFASLPETQAVFPAVNLGLAQVEPNDGNQTNVELANLKNAWDRAQARDPGGLVGSSAVRVAVAEGPVDMTHPDLRRNIGIHRGELPPRLFGITDGGRVTQASIAAHDCDPPARPDAGILDAGDGVISIRDLLCDPSIAPLDGNRNGRTDGVDLILDNLPARCDAGCWADGIDNDGNGFVDDLVGWNFFADNNDPSLPETSAEKGGWHATFVAGIIGAEGNSGEGIAGANWRVSIVGLRTGFFAPPPDAGSRWGLERPRVLAPAESLVDAFVYADDPANGVDVFNMSMLWTFERKDAVRGCAPTDGGAQNTTQNIHPEYFDAGVVMWRRAFSNLFSPDGGPLYVLAGGNSSHDTSSSSTLLRVPYDPMHSSPAVRDRLVAIGALRDATTKAEFSSYGGGTEIFAPGVAWKSLIPAQYTCRATAPLDADARCTAEGCPSEGSHVDCYSDGTSFAAPTVAGAAALLCAVDPSKRSNGRALRTAIVDASPLVTLEDCNGDAIIGARKFDAELLLNTAP